MSATQSDYNAILERFKQAYQNPEHYVLDAWLIQVGDETWIKYQLETSIADLDPEVIVNKMAGVPRVFEGMTTIITWWPDRD